MYTSLVGTFQILLVVEACIVEIICMRFNDAGFVVVVSDE